MLRVFDKKKKTIFEIETVRYEIPRDSTHLRIFVTDL